MQHQSLKRPSNQNRPPIYHPHPSQAQPHSHHSPPRPIQLTISDHPPSQASASAPQPASRYSQALRHQLFSFTDVDDVAQNPGLTKSTSASLTQRPNFTKTSGAGRSFLLHLAQLLVVEVDIQMLGKYLRRTRGL
jgi:hypothetical protein